MMIKVLGWLNFHPSIPTEENTDNTFLEQRPYLLLKLLKQRIIIGLGYIQKTFALIIDFWIWKKLLPINLRIKLTWSTEKSWIEIPFTQNINWTDIKHDHTFLQAMALFISRP